VLSLRNNALHAMAGMIILAVAGAASGLERFSFDQRYLVIPDRYMKDRCFVKSAGEWHCFMIAGNDSAIDWRVPGNEISFAHASTMDFKHWTIHPDILGIGTGTWDERNIWAPDIIPWGRGFRIFYTGVDSSIVQQMGLAESPDLFDWRPYPLNPIYRPDTLLFDWREGRWSNCRDPDIFRIADTLHVLHTVSTKDGFGAVDHAVSIDGLDWIDRGPIFVNDSDSVLESVQLIERNDDWYLFFNEYGVLGVSVIRSPSMNGPWDKDSRRVIGVGQAQEIFGDQPGTLISRHKSYRSGDTLGYVMKVDSLFWDEDGDPYIGEDESLWEDWSPIRLDDPDPGFGETGFEIFAEDSAFAYQPTFGENPTFRVEPEEVGVVGNSWIGTRERYRGPLTDTEEGGLVGDQAVGGIRSRDFCITGVEITFLIGGTNDPEGIYIALCDSRTHAAVFRETGTGFERLERRVWETDSLYGRMVYLKIVDASPEGHLNLDEIAEGGTHEPPADLPFAGYLFDPYPNPFGTDTNIVLRMDRDADVTVAVHDAAGNVINRLFDGRVPMGFKRFFWDGLNERGRSVACGVYFLRVESDGQARSKKMVRVR
jgi:hypothetical protein